MTETGKFFPAIQAATRATEIAPDWPEAYVTLGRAQLNFGEFKLAVQSFEKAQLIVYEKATKCNAQIGSATNTVPSHNHETHSSESQIEKKESSQENEQRDAEEEVKSNQGVNGSTHNFETQETEQEGLNSSWPSQIHNHTNQHTHESSNTVLWNNVEVETDSDVETNHSVTSRALPHFNDDASVEAVRGTPDSFTSEPPLLGINAHSITRPIPHPPHRTQSWIPRTVASVTSNDAAPVPVFPSSPSLVSLTDSRAANPPSDGSRSPDSRSNVSLPGYLSVGSLSGCWSPTMHSLVPSDTGINEIPEQWVSSAAESRSPASETTGPINSVGNAIDMDVYVSAERHEQKSNERDQENDQISVNFNVEEQNFPQLHMQSASLNSQAQLNSTENTTLSPLQLPEREVIHLQISSPLRDLLSDIETDLRRAKELLQHHTETQENSEQ